MGVRGSVLGVTTKLRERRAGSITLLNVIEHFALDRSEEIYASLCGVGIRPNLVAREEGEQRSDTKEESSLSWWVSS